jgi:hypothetical protein
MLDNIRVRARTQPANTTISVDQFQPFSSRAGIDTVMRLRFPYDPGLVSRLKALLAVYAVGHQYRTVGGWLPEHQAWFVEADVWDVVRDELQFLGYQIAERTP